MADRPPSITTWVGLDVGGVAYALNIQCVREIIRPLPMQSLPHAAKVVIGVVDHRGDVVPVIDLRVRFGTGERMDLAHTRWVIATRGERLVGLVVDRVTEVFRLNSHDAREVPDLGPHGDRRGVTAAYSHRGRLVFALDIDRVTRTDEEPWPLPLLAESVPAAEAS
ncbi:MAG TPA: chemotaxis protein CheW [Polyangiales bacterium]|nr:chemotaxis protein CheW [Polyangiales bacterium]